MGKGYHNYMSKKFFHPGNFENIKRVWMAQQKSAHEKKQEEDTLAQYQKEQEMYQNRALLGDEKAKLGLNFMYDPPPGVKRDREKEEDEPEYKFEWQRKYNAPRESYAKGDDTVRDQPFGIEVRNVRCLKCRKWGHINTDKVCPLFGKSITADLPNTGGNNPGQLMDQMEEEGLQFTKKVLSRQNDPNAANQQMVDSDAEEDEEVAFFLSLGRKEKKKLVKKLEKQRKKAKKARRKERKYSRMQEKTKETIPSSSPVKSDLKEEKEKQYAKNGTRGESTATRPGNHTRSGSNDRRKPNDRRYRRSRSASRENRRPSDMRKKPQDEERQNLRTRERRPRSHSSSGRSRSRSPRNRRSRSTSRENRKPDVRRKLRNEERQNLLSRERRPRSHSSSGRSGSRSPRNRRDISKEKRRRTSRSTSRERRRDRGRSSRERRRN